MPMWTWIPFRHRRRLLTLTILPKQPRRRFQHPGLIFYIEKTRSDSSVAAVPAAPSADASALEAFNCELLHRFSIDMHEPV